MTFSYVPKSIRKQIDFEIYAAFMYQFYVWEEGILSHYSRKRKYKRKQGQGQESNCPEF